MRLAACFPKEETNEIYIVYTDTLERNSSILLCLDTNKGELSLQEVSRYLDGKERSNKNRYQREFKNFSEICEIIDKDSNESVEQVPLRKSRHFDLREWLAFLSVCVVMTTNISIVHAFGTLFPFILSEFGESRANAATVQSALLGVGLCSGFVVGSIVQHFGTVRCGVVGSFLFSAGFISSCFATSVVYLVLSCGILSGVGFSFVTISSNQAASLCFEGQARLIGLAVVSSTIGIGGMIYPYLLTWMIVTYGLRGTFLLLGGITLNGIPMSLLWYKRNKDETNEQTNLIDFFALFKQLFTRVKVTMKYKPFVMALLGFSLAVMSVNMFEILALDVLESNGLTRNTGVILFIVLNGVSIPGRLIPGFIKRIHGMSSLMAPITGTLISGLGMLLLNITKALTGSTVACAALGLSKGMLLSSIQIIVLEMLDNTKFSVGLGIIFGLVGLCTTTVGPLNGLIRDKSGSYTVSLYGAACILLFSLVLFCASMVLNSRNKANISRKRFVSVFTVTRF